MRQHSNSWRFGSDASAVVQKGPLRKKHVPMREVTERHAYFCRGIPAKEGAGPCFIFLLKN